MKPLFTICKKGAQDKSPLVSNIITNEILKGICYELTGYNDYEVQWLDKRIEGKMFTLKTDETDYYITYTHPVVGGRNSYLQSVPTAYAKYLQESPKQDKKTEFCLYITTPDSGDNQTKYHKFIYRLLLSIGVKFLNKKSGLRGISNKDFVKFNTVKELIEERENNRDNNTANQSSYITNEGMYYHIYGKTFGANQKETVLLCMALCSITDKPIRLFQIVDNSSESLSENDVSAINFYAEKIVGKTINILDDTYEFDGEKDQYTQSETKEESLRTPRFIYNLLLKTGGRKKCALCGCEIDSIVQGAHIYPVCAIKKADIPFEKKLEMATDKNNGIWLCENHHKLFDRGLIRFDERKMIISRRLNDEEQRFVDSISTTKELSECECPAEMNEYFKKRDVFYTAEKIY